MGLVAAAELRAAQLDEEGVSVIGYGAQGRAQALNLRDSGVKVRIGLRPGSRHAGRASADGFPVMSPREAAGAAPVVALLVPDEVQPEVYESAIDPAIRAGGALVFAHGYNVRFGRIRPRTDIDVVLVAPFGIGEELRAEYAAGRGTAGLVAVAQDAGGRARDRALAYARALGHARYAVVESTFAEEAETDLFSEQAVLVGGLSALVRAGFECLVDAGYQPEIAYFSCLEEVRLMAAVMRSHGLAGLWERISSTAAFGGLVTGPAVINADSREAMREALADIRSGRFAERLSREAADGNPGASAAASRARAHPLEATRRRLAARRARDAGSDDGEMAS